MAVLGGLNGPKRTQHGTEVNYAQYSRLVFGILPIYLYGAVR
jgi:hypothetical protein